MGSDSLKALQSSLAKQNYKDMLQCMFDVTSPTTYSHCSEEQIYSSSTGIANLATARTMSPSHVSSFHFMSEDMYDEQEVRFDDTWLQSYDSGSCELPRIDNILG
jgi:hypothetical protein